MPKTSERRKNCELQIPSPNPTTNTSGWETLGKLTNIWKTDPKDAFPSLLEVWRESDVIMPRKPLLSVWRVGASVMRHKCGAAALILLWPLSRPFCTQMVTVGSTEKSWVGRGTDQDSRHELKEGPLTGLNLHQRDTRPCDLHRLCQYLWHMDDSCRTRTFLLARHVLCCS